MTDFGSLFRDVADAAAEFRQGLPPRRVAAADDLPAALARFEADLPQGSTPPGEVVRELVALAGPGITASAGPRFFGFVTGGALPAATAADMLAAAWDQCTFNSVLAPAATAVERVAGRWITGLLGLPSDASVGFVTGAQMSNTTGLAAARHRVLADAGWDVAARGLIGAPAVRVIAGAERHATIDASLRLLGLGTDCIESVAALPNGAMDMTALAVVLGSGDPAAPTIVCLQAGNVNTGAFDDLARGCEIAQKAGAWVHIDGAFGLWAGASPRLKHLIDGAELADSWCMDGHKWLNVPYDSALAICAHPADQIAAMAYSAPYLTGSEGGGAVDPLAVGPSDLTPESSRRARGFAVWAAMRELGRSGIAELVERCCDLARRLADGLAAGGATIVNDVVINQVLIDFPGRDVDAVAAAAQTEGTCWLGATTWRGRRLLRVSVSNYATTTADIDASVTAILAAAAGIAGREGFAGR